MINMNFYFIHKSNADKVYGAEWVDGGYNIYDNGVKVGWESVDVTITHFKLGLYREVCLVEYD